MFPNCYTCPCKVIQYNKHLLNGQNQETEFFSRTKILLDLEGFWGTEGVHINRGTLKFGKNDHRPVLWKILKIFSRRSGHWSVEGGKSNVPGTTDEGD